MTDDDELARLKAERKAERRAARKAREGEATKRIVDLITAMSKTTNPQEKARLEAEVKQISEATWKPKPAKPKEPQTFIESVHDVARRLVGDPNLTDKPKTKTRERLEGAAVFAFGLSCMIFPPLLLLVAFTDAKTPVKDYDCRDPGDPGGW